MPINNYIAPGTYVSELYKPRAVVPPGIGLGLVLVGIGSKLKGIVNEQVIRGKIYNETLTVAVGSPHNATLVNTSDENRGNTTVYKNGVPLPLTGYSFTSGTVVKIEDAYYTAGAVYIIDYVAVDIFIDELDETPVSIDSVGLFENSSNYEQLIDFDLSGTDLDWSILTAASFTGLNSEPFNLSTLDKVRLSLDGKPPLTVTITGAVQTAVTAAEVVADINAALIADGNYGTDYTTAASVATGKVKITSPNLDPASGYNSIVSFFDVTGSALDLIFDLPEVDAPYEYRGVGKRPRPGQAYFVSYKIDRPDEDYNTVRYFASDVDFYADIGLPAVGNDLANNGEIAWAQGIPEIRVIQVEDPDDDDYYTDNDFVVALDALVDQRLSTDLVVLRGSSVIRAKAKEIIELEAALTKSNFKRYWCGVPRDTDIGDVDTTDSLVYIAQRELSEAPDSQARGRYILVSPANWQRTLIQDTVEVTIDVDSNYAATLLAARTVGFDRASDSLFGKSLSGLTLEANYSDAEKRYAASNGIFVLYTDGAVIKVFDSLTTDASGDARYEEPSASTQKDNLAFKIIDAINTQLAGVVPDDVAEFIGTVKSVVGGVILGEIDAGNIGYYTDDNGAVRNIDYSKDIVAYRLSTDPRSYKFKYWVNLKYPAKRFYGEFTVDVPFAT